MNRVPMTKYGADKLRDELHHLKTVQRPEIVNAIAEARAHGDLRENAEYHAAKEAQSFMEGRIKEIEHKLGNAHVIDVTQMNNDGKVIFGATVHLMNCETEQKVVYQIVGDDEADLKLAKISVNSPIARALIGKFAEDVVNVQTPSGLVEYEIVKVEYI